ncbi:tetratricopeptide repeat protein [Prosthecomicrobium sp. N25]|uniref:tetratricopeptide repeat protein n=1 Tax=Prosthecomicrobium sp. N25 TaxID=3129254 RepID=UPI003077221C
MKILLILVHALVLVCCGSAMISEASGAELDDCMNSDPEISIPACTAALKSRTIPRSTLKEVFTNLGRSYRNKEYYRGSISYYKKALKIDSKHIKALIGQALTYSMIAEYNLAVTNYSTVIEIDPHNFVALFNRGNALSERRQHTGSFGDDDLAINDYSSAIKLMPTYAAAYNNRGMNYGLDKIRRSLDDFNKAISLMPESAIPYVNRAGVWHSLDRDDLAFMDYETAIKLDPGFAVTYYNRANHFAWKHEYKRAIADFTAAIELKPDFALAYYYRSHAFRESGDLRRSGEDLDTALKIRRDLKLFARPMKTTKGEYSASFPDINVFDGVHY